MKNIFCIIGIVLLASFTAQAQSLVFKVEPVKECITFGMAELTPLQFVGDTVIVNKKLFSNLHQHRKDTVMKISVTDFKILITPGSSKAAVNAALAKLNIVFTIREK